MNFDHLTEHGIYGIHKVHGIRTFWYEFQSKTSLTLWTHLQAPSDERLTLLPMVQLIGTDGLVFEADVQHLDDKLVLNFSESVSGWLVAVVRIFNLHTESFSSVSSISVNHDLEAPAFVNLIDSAGNEIVGSVSDVIPPARPGWHGSIDRVKFGHTGWGTDDGTSIVVEQARVAPSSTAHMRISVPIPTGYKATHAVVYCAASNAFNVYETIITSYAFGNKGSGTCNTILDIIDVDFANNNMITITVEDVDPTDYIYGGFVTIERLTYGDIVDISFSENASGDLAVHGLQNPMMRKYSCSGITTKTILHRLGVDHHLRYPYVMAVDNNNEIIDCEIDHTNANQLTVNFNESFTGTLFLIMG